MLKTYKNILYHILTIAGMTGTFSIILLYILLLFRVDVAPKSAISLIMCIACAPLAVLTPYERAKQTDKPIQYRLWIDVLIGVIVGCLIILL